MRALPGIHFNRCCILVITYHCMCPPLKNLFVILKLWYINTVYNPYFALVNFSLQCTYILITCINWHLSSGSSISMVIKYLLAVHADTQTHVFIINGQAVDKICYASLLFKLRLMCILAMLSMQHYWGRYWVLVSDCLIPVR